MIVVTGARGMLGRDLLALFGERAQGTCREDMDITSFSSVRATIGRLKPSVVVNAIAYTDVDGCETNRDLAFRVNGDGVRNLAVVTAEIGAKLVQVSSDYVFDGKGDAPLREDATVNPLSVYGRSKLAGEEFARMNPDHLIVRTQWLYGLHGRNFVETMLRVGQEKDELSVVNDQFGSPTWTADLALAMAALIGNDCRGTYHAANSGSCSWHGFAEAIFRESGMKTRVRPITTDELGRPAPRPLFSVLDCCKMERDTGHCAEGWREALKKYLLGRSSHGKG